MWARLIGDHEGGVVMPVKYHYPKEKRPESYLTEPAFLVMEALLLCAFLVMQFGFRVPEWSNDGDRINGVIVDKWVSSTDETDQYRATIRDIETGRRFELDINSDEAVGDRVEAIASPDDESKAVRSGEVQLYVTVWTWSLAGLVVWPALWVILRWMGTVEDPWP